MSVDAAWRQSYEEASLNARLTLATVHAAAQRGVPEALVFREVGLDRDALLEEDARITVSHDQAVWRTCEGHLGASLRGMDVLAAMPRGALGLADMLFSTAPTFGDAIRTAAEFMPLVREGLSVDLVEHKDVLRIAYSFDSVQQPLASGSVEVFLGAVLTYGAACLGRVPEVRTLSLPAGHRYAPEELTEITARFGTRDILCDELRPIVLVPKALQQVRQVTAAPRLHRVLRAHAADVVNERACRSQFLLHVRHLMLLELENGSVSLEGVARRLHQSVRSTQRQLAMHGSSFGELRDAVRRDLATLYLRDARMALSEISFRLAYRSTQAFHRAFHGWYGKSPTTWRAQHRGDVR